MAEPLATQPEQGVESEGASTPAFPLRLKEVTYEDPATLLANPHNFRIHPRFQQEIMAQILKRHGWVGLVTQNDRTGHLLDGHMRVQVALREGEKVPVLHVDIPEELEAEVLGSYDAVGDLAVLDGEKFKALPMQAQQPEGIRSLMADTIRAYEEKRAALGDGQTDPARAHEQGAKDPLRSKVDLIFSAGGQSKRELGLCCLAVACGWGYGFQSAGAPCRAADSGLHKAMFIDNEFKAYDHQKHLDVVAQFRPKYATVRDVMSRAQCAELGIDYYPLDQILRWAEDVAKWADNAIIIPKFSCLDEIPKEYMLGYSVPSSYGRTPLPIQDFKGRRVHLLGGSPRRQITYWQALRTEVESLDQSTLREGSDPDLPLPDGVVSLDTNYLLKIAEYGQFWGPDGATHALDELGYGRLTNPLYPALSLSLGYFAAYFGRLAKVTSTAPIPEDER